MKEYIDREEVFKAYEDEQRKSGPWSFKNLINSVPAADVVPVRRGRWLKQDDYTECSECAYWYYSPENEDSGDRLNYCPNCGAYMRMEVRQ